LDTSRSPFSQGKRLIYHGAHHKMGTVWIMRVLERVAAEFGMKLTKSKTQRHLPDPDTDFFVALHSQFDMDLIGEAVGSHMIRDPRDAIVSGYHYHLWTSERWVKIPQDRFGGISYQQLLQSMDEAEGLQEEIHRFAASVDCLRMKEWDFDHPQVLEIRYEDLWANQPEGFNKLFRHYGFSEPAVDICLRIAMSQSFEQISKAKRNLDNKESHTRNGRPGQWRTAFSASHLRLIKAKLGDLIVQMGYESSNNWKT